MASTLNRRVVALEERQVPAGGRFVKILFIPCGLSEIEEAEWCEEHVPQAEALSLRVMLVRFMRPGEMREA